MDGTHGWADGTLHALVLARPQAVLVWSRPLERWQRPELLALLDAEVLAGLWRLRREEDRSRRVTARALLARAGLIAAERGLLPPGPPLRLHEAPSPRGRGKPVVEPAGWRASVSHDNAVVAVLARAEVGVDTQGLASAPGVRAIASSFTGGEQEWLADHPRDTDALRLWTAKEALLKARGTGFFSDPRLSGNDTLRGTGAQLAHWRPFPDAVAALAVLGPGSVDWPAGWEPFGSRGTGLGSV